MERQLYKNLLSWADNKDRKPLILEGARQVGKTYLLKEFARKYFGDKGQAFHYFDFEQEPELSKIFAPDLNPERILQELGTMHNAKIAKSDLLIFDEIQACPRALTSLKYFYQDCPELAICSAGSLLGIELGASSFPVGKVDFLKLHPMTFIEFLAACDKNLLAEHLQDTTNFSEAIHTKIWTEFVHYLVVGGLPDAVKQFLQDPTHAGLHAARATQKKLLTSYLADMAKHSGKENSMHLERLWRNIPNQLAKEQGSTKFQFKNVITGVRNYDRLASTIDWLDKAGLLLRVPIVNKSALPLTAYSKENTFKLYVFDVGLLGALSDLPIESIVNYRYGSYKGYVVENFAAQELISQGIDLFSWKENRSEIEFLIQAGEDLVPIEIKAGHNLKARSLTVYHKKYLPKNSFLFSGNWQKHTTQKIIDGESTTLHRYPLYTMSQMKDTF